jgi:hypothetical protein
MIILRKKLMKIYGQRLKYFLKTETNKILVPTSLPVDLTTLRFLVVLVRIGIS